jgi:hypothetical protein
VPATGLVPTALPVDAVYYDFPSSYTGQDLPSIEHRHAIAVDHSQPGPPAACAMSYGITGLISDCAASTTTTTTTLAMPSTMTATPAHAPHLIIARDQGESGHDPVLQDATTQSVMNEVSTH